MIFALRNLGKYLNEDVKLGRPALAVPADTRAEAWKILEEEMHRVGRHGKPMLPEPLATVVKKVGLANLTMAKSDEAPRMFARPYLEVVLVS